MTSESDIVESKQNARKINAVLEKLSGVEPAIIRKGWFAFSHIILEPGSLVADMGCGNGDMTYVMASLNPHINFIGVDKSKKSVNNARKKYFADNLEYRVGDINKCIFDESSLDAIINSYILHDIYSHSKFNERVVRLTMKNHIDMLKPGGVLFINDYARPPPEEYVLIELPDVVSHGKELHDLSEVDLLIWFSENARPSEKSPECRGFYLEELPPKLPKTRLFRLPYEWAYEFVMRKDNRDIWETELPKEYTFFTKREFRKELRSLGTRVLYSAPHWDDSYIKSNFENKFRLYKDNGQPIGAPPTSFIAVAQKVGEGKSLTLEERRPSREAGGRLRIFAMRNEANGKIIDIATRDHNDVDILPYRIDEHGELNVFVHDGMPRGIVNAVPRQGTGIDGKRWSGHMMEALCVDKTELENVKEKGIREVIKFAVNNFGLKPAIGASIEEGPIIYPAPDYIDERIETNYLRIESGNIRPLSMVTNSKSVDFKGFSNMGKIRELPAQSILNAITVGMIPDCKLETQILSLYRKLGMKATTWKECPLILEDNPEDVPYTDPKDLIKIFEGKDDRFKECKGISGNIKVTNSVFVDEGYSGGGPAGLGSKNIDFIIRDEGTVNKAVVLLLTKNFDGDVLAAVASEYLPIPQRYTGNGAMLDAPSFILPKEVENMDMARKYIADKLDTNVENVVRLGESYFVHSGMTQQRIFPFAASKVKLNTREIKEREGGPLLYIPLRKWYDLFHARESAAYSLFVLFGKAFVSIYQETDHTFNIYKHFYDKKQNDKPLVVKAQNIYDTSPGIPSASSPEANVTINMNEAKKHPPAEINSQSEPISSTENSNKEPILKTSNISDKPSSGIRQDSTPFRAVSVCTRSLEDPLTVNSEEISTHIDADEEYKKEEMSLDYES